MQLNNFVLQMYVSCAIVLFKTFQVYIPMILDVFLSFYSQMCWCLLACAVTCCVPLLYLVHVIGNILDAQIINVNFPWEVNGGDLGQWDFRLLSVYKRVPKLCRCFILHIRLFVLSLIQFIMQCYI